MGSDGFIRDSLFSLWLIWKRGCISPDSTSPIRSAGYPLSLRFSLFYTDPEVGWSLATIQLFDKAFVQISLEFINPNRTVLPKKIVVFGRIGIASSSDGNRHVGQGSLLCIKGQAAVFIWKAIDNLSTERTNRTRMKEKSHSNDKLLIFDRPCLRGTGTGLRSGRLLKVSSTMNMHIP